MSEEIKKFERTSDNLVKDTVYKYNEEGKINWRAMLKPEYLVFNTQYEAEIAKKYNKPSSELKVTEVEDKYLLILLAGIKYLAKLRGYISVKPHIISAQPNFVAVETEIIWIPNVETANIVESFGDGADATFENTNGFGRNFLTSIAINRAFIRAVRNYLEINIVGADEISKNLVEKEQTSSAPSIITPTGTLKKMANDLNLSFEVIKNGASTKYKDKIESNPSSWKDFDSVPPRDCWTLMDLLKK